MCRSPASPSTSGCASQPASWRLSPRTGTARRGRQGNSCKASAPRRAATSAPSGGTGGTRKTTSCLCSESEPGQGPSTDAPPISTKTDIISAVMTPVARSRETPPGDAVNKAPRWEGQTRSAYWSISLVARSSCLRARSVSRRRDSNSFEARAVGLIRSPVVTRRTLTRLTHAGVASRASPSERLRSRICAYAAHMDAAHARLRLVRPARKRTETQASPVSNSLANAQSQDEFARLVGLLRRHASGRFVE